MYNDEWGSIKTIKMYTMMLPGLTLDVSAVMSAVVAVIVLCFNFERLMCGRPCRWRLPTRDDQWERACGAPCGRSCSHRADVPPCCPQHGTCNEETLIERMIHLWILLQKCRSGGLEACQGNMGELVGHQGHALIAYLSARHVTFYVNDACRPAAARADLHAYAGG